MSGIGFAASGRSKSEARSGPSARLRRRAISLGVLAGILTALLLLVADAALASRRMLADISAARNALIDGGNAVVTGDPATATRFFIRAADRAEGAVAAAGRPGVRLFGAMPVIGDNVSAARAVAQAQVDTARAGITMARAAGTLRWDNILLPGAATLGNVDLPTLKAATPAIVSVATQLERALHTLQLAGTGRLIGPVGAGYDNALLTLGREAALAADARDLMKVAPGLLGGKGERRYLVAVQSLAQPFGSGGRVVATGVLTARAGKLTLEPLAPADAALADAAVSPDVPTSAAAMLDTVTAAGGGSLDGVIVIDSVGLQDLLWMVGDVQTDAWPTAISQNDAVSILDGEALQGTDVAAADALQATLSSEILTQALQRRPSTEAFGTAAAELVAGRHFAIYSTSEKVQTLLSRLGATGRFVNAGNPIAVVWNTTGPARTGTLVRRPTSVSVILDSQRVAHMRAVVDLNNDAANGPPSVQLGPAFVDEPVGGYAADVSVYLPRGAERITIETSSPTQTVVAKDPDLGLPVATAPLAAPPGGSISMIVNAQVPEAATRVDSGFEYRIRILPQPSAEAQVLRVQIKIPDGMQMTGATEGLVIGGNIARYAGTPQGPVVLIVRYR